MASNMPRPGSNSTGQADIIMGVIVFILGFIAIATAWGTISYMTALASWIAGVVMIIRGIRKTRGQS